MGFIHALMMPTESVRYLKLVVLITVVAMHQSHEFESHDRDQHNDPNVKIGLLSRVFGGS